MRTRELCGLVSVKKSPRESDEVVHTWVCKHGLPRANKSSRVSKMTLRANGDLSHNGKGQVLGPRAKLQCERCPISDEHCSVYSCWQQML